MSRFGLVHVDGLGLARWGSVRFCLVPNRSCGRPVVRQRHSSARRVVMNTCVPRRRRSTRRARGTSDSAMVERVVLL